ncbi:hypothetical protein Lxx03170 [Leifsonia xyli subsp. xyli str. CTCB07]|uniref:Uncharacterized protein n=1 Tax=Leifsonia xyli subsp. xyli (strain CTCB07) TaxID=281090 RepID=Q6AH09_LEIXX|nr:hypothetical protein Lxx03170 [Leifsonia xyli subsp. xyli str. CTCB07]
MTAARMLLEELGGAEPYTRSVGAAATLVVRSSTAPPH